MKAQGTQQRRAPRHDDERAEVLELVDLAALRVEDVCGEREAGPLNALAAKLRREWTRCA